MSTQNLEIQFSPVIVKILKMHSFQADQLGSVLLILFSLYEDNLELLDVFDDYNLERRAILLYKELEIRGFLLQEDDDEKHFSLTKEGVELVEYIKAEFTKTNQEVTSEKIAISGVEQLKDAITSNDPEGWIDEWMDIFPRGVKSGGRLIRSDKQSCLRKMRVFLREYEYDKDTIIKATRAYIESKRNDNFAYTRCAVYFIFRVDTSKSDKISDLASWCDQTLHEGNQPQGENNLEIMV